MAEERNVDLYNLVMDISEKISAIGSVMRVLREMECFTHGMDGTEQYADAVPVMNILCKELSEAMDMVGAVEIEARKFDRVIKQAMSARGVSSLSEMKDQLRTWRRGHEAETSS